MMETIKRHLFLVALGGGVAVVTLAVVVVTYFAYMAPNDKLSRSYANTKGLAEKIQQSPIFTVELVDALAKQDELRKGQYANLLAAIRKEGAARKPLVPGVFPTTTDSGKRLNFKNKYDAELRRFAKDILHAVTAPGVVEKDVVRSEEEGLMYIHPKMSFARPDWVDRPDAPGIDRVREGQENLWLMEDVVGIIARMNEDLRPKDQRPTMANSPIKEIVEIKIGSDMAVLTGSKMGGGMGRYVSASPAARKADDKGDKKDAKDKEAKEPEKAEAVPRAPTLSGRWSAPGFYEVLPFKLVVVIESRYSGELIRRLKGTESFIGVGAFRLKPVSESAKELMRSRRDYGAQAIVRLEVAAESLVFQLEGGRVTTVPAKVAAATGTATKAK